MLPHNRLTATRDRRIITQIVIRSQFYVAGINSIVELADNRGAALNQGFTRADIRTAAQT